MGSDPKKCWFESVSKYFNWIIFEKILKCFYCKQFLKVWIENVFAYFALTWWSKPQNSRPVFKTSSNSINFQGAVIVASEITVHHQLSCQFCRTVVFIGINWTFVYEITLIALLRFLHSSLYRAQLLRSQALIEYTKIKLNAVICICKRTFTS